ncbi:MAG: DUF4197 domain-containing protein [Bacteroidia bacterium]|nr:DUF4197 domain-containing protein [Bacteroidia bacterium]
MKTIAFLWMLIAPFWVSAQWGNVINQVKDRVNGSKSVSGLSEQEVINGLKEALKVSTNKSAESASKIDGFLKNPAIFIPLPPELARVKGQLDRMGFSSQTAEAEKLLNRAAEDAAKKAAPIFIDAITKLTLKDAKNILLGNERAATDYLMGSTTPALVQAFAPIIAQSLDKVGANRTWNTLTTSYNKIPFVTKINTNLTDYTTQLAIKGVFTLMAVEESKIRKDPAARINDILKKVFGAVK